MNPFKSQKKYAREIARPKVPPEVVARFRPPLIETAAIAFLMAVQGVAWLAAGAILIAHFATQWVSLDWLLPLCGVLFWLGVMRGVWLGQEERGDGFFLIISETVVVLLGFRFLLLFYRPEIASFTDGLAALDAIFIAFAWSQGRSLGINLFLLYSQPYEVFKEDGGVATGENVHYVEHFASYRIIQQRWMWSGLFIVAIVIVAVILLPERETNQLSQATLNNILIWAIVYVTVGLLILSLVRLRYLRTHWQLNRLNEPPTIAHRWLIYAIVLLVSAGAIMALLPRTIDTSWLNFMASGQRDEEAAKQFQEVLRRLFPCSTPDDPRCRIRETDPNRTGELFRLPEELSIILLSLIIAGVVFGMGFLLIKSGIPLPSLKNFSWQETWQSFINWLISIFAPRIRAEKLEVEPKKSVIREFFNRFRREHIPSDLRGQVRFYYKHTLERAARAGYPRKSGTTPDEFANQVVPKLNQNELESDLKDLTQLYNEARFSPHPIEAEQVGTAAGQTKRLIAYFRQLKRIKPEASE